jgi:hypothetical protein
MTRAISVVVERSPGGLHGVHCQSEVIGYAERCSYFQREAEQAERERDEALAKFARCGECGGANGVEPFCDDCYVRDVDAAVAEAVERERARCLSVVQAWMAPNRTHETCFNIYDAIRNGQPAPTGGEGKP